MEVEMEGKKVKTLALVLLVFFGLASPAVAACDGHQAIMGENLWTDAAASLGVPDSFAYVDMIKDEIHRIEAANPKVDWPSMTRPDTRYPGQGRDIVLIQVGQCIHGLKLPGAIVGSTALGAKSFAPLPPLASGTTGQSSTTSKAWTTDNFVNFGLLLLGILLLCLLYRSLADKLDAERTARKEAEDARVAAEQRLALEIDLHQDPVTSGTPMVPGGVNDETVDTRFAEIAAQRYGASAVEIDIIERTAGQLFGTLMVQYRGQAEPQARIHRGERGYRARIRRRSDGLEGTFYLLQACGNEVSFGGVTNHAPGPDFRFVEDVPEPVVAPAPTAAPAPSPTTPVDSMAGKKLAIEFKSGKNGEASRLMLKGMSHEGFSFDIDPDGKMEFVFHEAPVRPTEG